MNDRPSSRCRANVLLHRGRAPGNWDVAGTDLVIYRLTAGDYRVIDASSDDRYAHWLSEHHLAAAGDPVVGNQCGQHLDGPGPAGVGW